ncbi:Hypothetical Protein FCC1311_001472 [Hondaea fermentalgiana]|uniref:Uncharacterized protein n=1 Tax=Hondaea fermentalgiana TaxID=2315210 RepID=A0A2R5G2H2_9STRA|nr:Hypothetical Protein FCC1311_001472 [Hondaea fermentalgiana]|eukprot:GBG23928.1 Hypothetical Protein FCC1311_001472 [Hondaea fermentalgiana]
MSEEEVDLLGLDVDYGDGLQTSSGERLAGSPKLPSADAEPEAAKHTSHETIVPAHDQEQHPHENVSPMKDIKAPPAAATKTPIISSVSSVSRRRRVTKLSRLAKRSYCSYFPVFNGATWERKRQEAIQREATFSPKLISSKKKRENRATTPGKSRYDMLYADAASRQAQMHRRANEEEACTFTPKTNWTRKAAKAGDAAASNGTPGSGARKSAPSPARRSETLYANAKALEAKRKSLAENRLREEAKECSFKPQITARGKAKRANSPGPTARMAQLYEEAKAKEARIAAAQARRELEGCTFQPNINSRRRSSGAGPTPSPDAVQERLSRYQKESERRREQLRKEHLEKEKEELTFQPNIIAAPGAKRPSTPQRTPSQGAIHERLYNEATRQQEREKEPSSANSGSSATKKRAPSPGVFDRLATPKAPPANATSREDTVAIEELKECTFTPNTRPGSARRASAGAAGSGSASKPFWDRLSKENEGVLEVREEMRKQRELSECTFRPVLNRRMSSGSAAKAASTTASDAGSKASSAPIWERLNGEAKLAKAREEELARQREAAELAACTFKPQISSNVQSSVSSASKNTKPIWDRLADTKTLSEKHEALERQREEAALRECTFAPQLSPPASSGVSPSQAQSKPTQSSPKSNSSSFKGLSYLDRVAAQSKTAASSASKAKTAPKPDGDQISSHAVAEDPKKSSLESSRQADQAAVATNVKAESAPKTIGLKPSEANGVNTGVKDAATSSANGVKPGENVSSSNSEAVRPSAIEKELPKSDISVSAASENGGISSESTKKQDDAIDREVAPSSSSSSSSGFASNGGGSARLNLEQKIASIMLEAEADE